MTSPKTETKETPQATEGNTNDTVNKVIRFDPTNWETVQNMSKVTFTDPDTLMNAAVLTLASLSVDDILVLMDNVHNQRKERIRANFS